MGLKRFVVTALAMFMSCKNDPPPPPPAPAAAIAAQQKQADEAEKPPAQVVEEVTDDSPFAWVIHSGDGEATLRQKPAAPGKCFLECLPRHDTGATGFTVNNADCFAQKPDWKFVAPDCSRTVVMFPAPPRGKPWRQVEAMRVYKGSKLDYPVMGIAVLPDEKLIKGSRSWLKGCYGVPGEPPHYSQDGLQVDYESIDNQTHSVPLKAP